MITYNYYKDITEIEYMLYILISVIVFWYKGYKSWII